MAEADSEYDFIFLSVRHGFVKEAVETLRKNNIKGTPVSYTHLDVYKRQSMLRSAAKNHASVTVVVDPADYAVCLLYTSL